MCLMNAQISVYLLFVSVHSLRQTIAQPTCPAIPVFEVEQNLDFFDKAVIGDFKVWQLAFMTAACGLVITIVLCCIFRCRIPRTKQEIEAEFVRRRITKQFRKHLNKISVKDVELNTVLPKVLTLEANRLQKGSVDVKKTLKDRIFALFASNGSVEKQSSIEEDLPSEEMKNKWDAFQNQISIEFTDATETNENVLQEAADQINKIKSTVEAVAGITENANNNSSEHQITKSEEMFQSSLSSLEKQNNRKLFKQVSKVDAEIETVVEDTENENHIPNN